MTRIFLRTGLVQAAVITLISTAPAWAVYNQQLILTGEGATSLPGASISFTTSAGEPVAVTDNARDDDGVFILVFPGNTSESGTLAITSPDGAIRRIAVPAAGPNDKIVVDLPSGTARLQPGGESLPASGQPGDGPGTYIRVGGGIDSLKIPTVGAGTEITSDGEFFVAESDKRISGLSGSAAIGVQTPVLGGVTLEFSFLYGEADGETSGSVAQDANPVGIVYHDFSPNEATGIFLGSAGLNSMTEVEVDYRNFNIKAVWDMPQGNSGRISPYVSLFYSKLDQSHWSFVDSPTYGSQITAESLQEIDEDYWGLGIGAMWMMEAGNGPSFGFGGGLKGIYRDAQLNSHQHNVCGLCGNPLQQEFDVDIEDSDDGFTFGAHLDAVASMAIADNLRAGFYGSFIYLDKVGRVMNPETGDDLFVDNNPTHLGHGSSTIWRGGLFVSLDF